MTDMTTIPSKEDALTELTVRIVAAYVAHNQVAALDLPAFIGKIKEALARRSPRLTEDDLHAQHAVAPPVKRHVEGSIPLNVTRAPLESRRIEEPEITPPPASPRKPMPAYPISKSVTPTHIYCLEDGKRLRSLRLHLERAHGLTPDAYRAKWGLPPSYPMIAPEYAEARRQIAHKIGLGHGIKAPFQELADVGIVEPEAPVMPNAPDLPPAPEAAPSETKTAPSEDDAQYHY